MVPIHLYQYGVPSYGLPFKTCSMATRLCVEPENRFKMLHDKFERRSLLHRLLIELVFERHIYKPGVNVLWDMLEFSADRHFWSLRSTNSSSELQISVSLSFCLMHGLFTDSDTAELNRQCLYGWLEKYKLWLWLVIIHHYIVAFGASNVNKQELFVAFCTGRPMIQSKLHTETNAGTTTFISLEN